MNQSILNRPRLDKFNLVLDIPKVLRNRIDSTLLDVNNPDKIQFTVFGSPVPKISVPSINLPYGGQNMSISSYSRPAYPSLELRYLIDNGYQNYWLLWKWLNLFNEQETSLSEITNFANVSKDKIQLKNSIEDYVSTFTILALDEYNNKLISFKYRDVFITSLGELNFSHQTNELITGSVSFAYNQLIVDLVNNINDSNC